VLSGRLKAVLVASLATIILIGASGMATTAATDPSGLAAFMRAVARVESGGSYTAQNGSSGAYGKYQIMPSSWQAWAAAYLGNGAAKPTPANQEIVAAAKFRALHRWLGNWRRVAYWWLTGSSQTSGWSAAASRYVTKVMVYYNAAPVTRVVTPTPVPVPVKAKVPPPATVTVTAVPLQRYAETAGTIVYRGAWTLASHTSYAGRAVKYATQAGATASFTFSGKRIIWYGPVGPTRGQARIRIDGSYVKTVDLRTNAFTARRAIFSASWKASAKHTIVIEVVGNAGHPYVAIDEFAVGR
jgi:hypothetical protein